MTISSLTINLSNLLFEDEQRQRRCDWNDDNQRQADIRPLGNVVHRHRSLFLPPEPDRPRRRNPSAARKAGNDVRRGTRQESYERGRCALCRYDSAIDYLTAADL